MDTHIRAQHDFIVNGVVYPFQGFIANMWTWSGGEFMQGFRGNVLFGAPPPGRDTEPGTGGRSATSDPRETGALACVAWLLRAGGRGAQRKAGPSAAGTRAACVGARGPGMTASGGRGSWTLEGSFESTLQKERKGGRAEVMAQGQTERG